MNVMVSLYSNLSGSGTFLLNDHADEVPAPQHLVIPKSWLELASTIHRYGIYHGFECRVSEFY